MTFYEIDGQQVFPNDSTIKVTKENPFIKESDSYTYDVTLPLSIKANRDVIGNLNRLDVQKKAKTFDMCRIYADNRLLISGTGTMTSVSNTDVKIQIVAGNSEVKYKSKLKNDYIDNINYPDVSSEYEGWGAGRKFFSDGTSSKLLADGYFGEEGKYIFSTIYDQTNDRVANLFYAETTAGKSPLKISIIEDIAVQPNLIYILHQIFAYMGYALKSDDYNVDPWNSLYIASARITTVIKYALPHWKVETFLEEFRKLFNATYVFDETGKTVKIVRADSVTGNEVTNYEASDEFSSDYDDDGVVYLGSSNLKYNLRDSAKRSEIDELSTEILQKFTIETYKTWDDIESKTETLNGLNSASIGGAAQIKTFLTTLYKGPDGWVYFKYISQDEYDELYKNVTDESLKNWYVPKKTGFFTQLLRDVSSDDNVTLNIVPAAMTILDKNIDYSAYCVNNIPMPCAENTKSDVSTLDEDSYIRTQDVIENSETEDTDTDTEDERMEVFFLKKGTPLSYPYTKVDISVVVPKTGTDYRALSSTQIGNAETLALDCAKSSDLLDQDGNQISAEYIGKFHSSGLAINPKEQIVIKFLSDDVPDPKKIYIFRNKKYICSKIEIEIKNDKIERLKTGYFYEMN